MRRVQRVRSPAHYLGASASGILELKKIGVLAEAHRIEMAPHNAQDRFSTLASIHVNATTPAATILESSLHRDPWITELFDGGGAVVQEGYAELPTKAGLGVTLNEKVAALHPYKPMVFGPEHVFGDGSVSDP